MKDMNKAEYVHQVFESISTGYDKANNRISLGLQGFWKQMLIDKLTRCIPFRTRFLDICCGTGDIAIAVAQERPDVKVTGGDFSTAMLCVARKKGIIYKNVRWRRADALDLPWPDETFDAVSISFGLRNTADYHKAVSEMMRVVKTGGFVFCLDSFVPDNSFVLPFYRLYFRYVMPLLGGGKNHNTEYQWLYKSTEQFLRKSELMDLYREVGFRNIDSKSRMFGACSMVWGQKVDIH